jgi:hypothetical protein
MAPMINGPVSHHCWCGSTKRPYCTKHKVPCAKHRIDHYPDEECYTCRQERQVAEREATKQKKERKLQEAALKKAADDEASYGKPKPKHGGNKKLMGKTTK